MYEIILHSFTFHTISDPALDWLQIKEGSLLIKLRDNDVSINSRPFDKDRMP
jgi:hypothetical protein